MLKFKFQLAAAGPWTSNIYIYNPSPNVLKLINEIK